MPRTARSAVAGICYHVMNRGNARATVFHDAVDYRCFLRLARAACSRFPVAVLAHCLMPNHFHFVLRPEASGALARWLHWLTTSHAHRHHRRHGTSGHIWQGRFKAFPVQQDGHLLAVMRYVERNALRAGLVDAAEAWQWGSLALRLRAGDGEWLAESPVPLPRDWLWRVNQGEPANVLGAMRNCAERGAPFGDRQWVNETATALGLESSLRPRGRPRRVRD